MATTPNYGWPVPVATDLVKDGYEAIADLGDAIDATVYALPSSGLTLINTTTFSAIASQSVNNVFSATYTNYKILVAITTSTTGSTNVNFRLRNAGTDLTSSIYIRGEYKVGEQSSFGAGSDNNTTAAELTLASAGTNIPALVSLDIALPFTTSPKPVASFGSGRLLQLVGGYINSSATADGFSIISTSAFTGSVSVYGYTK